MFVSVVDHSEGRVLVRNFMTTYLNSAEDATVSADFIEALILAFDVLNQVVKIPLY